MRSYGTSGVLVRSRVPAVGHAVDEGELGRLASTQPAPGRDPSLFWRALVGAGVVAVFVLAALTAYSGRPAETWQLKGGQGGRGPSLTKPTSFRVSLSSLFFGVRLFLALLLARSVRVLFVLHSREREQRLLLFILLPVSCCSLFDHLLSALSPAAGAGAAADCYHVMPSSVSACFFTAAAKRASWGAINCWSCIMVDPGSAFTFDVVMHHLHRLATKKA